MKRIAQVIVAANVLIACGALGQDQEFEKATEKGAFILTQNTHSSVSIGVDTTDPGFLLLAIAVQETVFALGGAEEGVRERIESSNTSEIPQEPALHRHEDPGAKS